MTRPLLTWLNPMWSDSCLPVWHVSSLYDIHSRLTWWRREFICDPCLPMTWLSHFTYEWVMSHITSHQNESRHTKVTHVYLRHDSFLCNMHHLYVIGIIYEICIILIWYAFYFFWWVMSHVTQKWLMSTYDMTHSYVICIIFSDWHHPYVICSILMRYASYRVALVSRID